MIPFYAAAFIANMFCFMSFGKTVAVNVRESSKVCVVGNSNQVVVGKEGFSYCNLTVLCVY